jgi:hypothetical protein
MVPAGELPIWEAHFAAEPWGFKAQDMLASKSVLQLGQAMGRLKPGVSVGDFMFKDKFENGQLTRDEFNELSKQEQHLYCEREINRMKRVLN